MTAYPLKRLDEEVAFIAYHFNWSYETVLNLEHRERQKWCTEISRIHKEMNSSDGNVSLEEI